MFDDLSADQITRAALGFAATLVSLTFHEAAHAGVARLKGDRTASDAGRLTLNPIAHIDPFGTVLLPLIGAFSNLPIIGWAKPVPVDLRNLKNPRWDHLQIAAAGPLANLLLSALSLAVYVANGPTGIGPFLLAMVWVNAFLGVFNLLPFPPLDGGTVAATLLPPALGLRYMALVRPYGTWILFLLLAVHGLDWLPRVAEAYVQGTSRLFGWSFGA